MKYKIALAQIDSVLGNVEKNIEKHSEYIEKAIGNDINLILFPELSLTGYVLRDLNYEVSINPFKSDILSKIKKLSNHIDIVLGGVEEGDDYGLYNSAFLFSEGECKFVHRKIYLPTYGLFEEQRYFSTGKEVNSIQTKIGKIGILICEDFWHVPLPYILAKQGVNIILGLSSSPTRISPNDTELKQYEVNSGFHRTYANLLSTYIAWCNRVGFEEGMNYWGGSEIVLPGGEVLKSGKLFDEDFLTGEIDYNITRNSRLLSKHFIDDDINFTIDQLKKCSLK
jgi:predicted amidohydrolase